MKNNKGVTLMSLVITIVVMIILISIVGYFSLDSIKNSNIANEKKELADVSEYVSNKKVKLLMEEFNVVETYGEDKILTVESLNLLATGLNDSEKDKIQNVNQEDKLNDNYKYFYITAEDLNKETLSTSEIVVKDAKNNYIINFYTGTVIGLYDNGERINISGNIKGLPEINNELDI